MFVWHYLAIVACMVKNLDLKIYIFNSPFWLSLSRKIDKLYSIWHKLAQKPRYGSRVWSLKQCVFKLIFYAIFPTLLASVRGHLVGGGVALDLIFWSGRLPTDHVFPLSFGGYLIHQGCQKQNRGKILCHYFSAFLASSPDFWPNI